MQHRAQESTQVLGRQLGRFEDRGEGAAAQLAAVDGYDDRVAAVGVTKVVVAAADAIKLPALAPRRA